MKPISWTGYAVTYVVVLVLALPYYKDPSHWGTLDWADIPFHEAGHYILIWAPQFIYALGGTLGQLAFPVGFTVYFFWKGRDVFAGWASAFWVSVNFFQIGVYMRDARFMLLPLFGGDIHDWNFLFGRMSLLHQSVQIGEGAKILGLLLMTVSLIGMATFLWQQRPGRDEENSGIRGTH